MTKIEDIMADSKAWPFQEARKIIDRLDERVPAKGYALFETGYGPSGLPHVGTFAEVARTDMVRRAFESLSECPTKLICFSDDLDGFRKVPDNVPNKDMLAAHLGKPLTRVPDPFEKFESFGAHNNARLREFLDRFGFDYDFYSSTECYASGRFDETLLQILKNYESVIQVILPTLGEERRKTYSPFLPICPRTGVVLQVPLTGMDASKGTITYQDENGENLTVPVTGGNCKLQWKVDWAMRWQALDVDYEMSGKDLIESVRLSSAVQRILGGQPPEGFSYELFLDENGEKISKSKGNGLTIDEWLRYASPESLSFYMYQNPRRAKRLYFDVIPKAVDEYYTRLKSFPGEEQKTQIQNPVYHIHGGEPPEYDVPVSFNLLLNLVGTAHTEERDILWGFITRGRPEVTARSHPELDRLLGFAICYYQDFIAPTKKYRLPSDSEQPAFIDLLEKLKTLPGNAPAEDIQTIIYGVGKTHDFESLGEWFKALYEVLLGQPQGPRMGSFIALFGLNQTIQLLEQCVAGKALGD